MSGLVRGSDYAATAFEVLVIATAHLTVARAKADDVRFH
jgi:hypothetical protein